MTAATFITVLLGLSSLFPPTDDGLSERERRDSIRESRVTAWRPLRESGDRITRLDSTALKENISFSLSDALAYNSSMYIKQYGRASLSTVSFRGTSASHTQVLWNGMKINSPMLGMTDFSMIPSYFIDKASLLHGTTSLQEVSGGLGGAVILETGIPDQESSGGEYIQGIGSFWTTDEYLRLTWNGGRWKTRTRILYSSSPNRFKFTNMDKKENIYDEDRNIIGSYHPVERYEGGAFHDLHLMQEVAGDLGRGHRFSFSAWYLRSRRDLPQLSVSYGDRSGYINQQDEDSFRAVAGWDKDWARTHAEASVGYGWTSLDYDYARDKGNGDWIFMTRSRSKVHTFHARAACDQRLAEHWMLTVHASVHQHLVSSQDLSILVQGDGGERVGYKAGRTEVSAYAALRWKPAAWAGLALSLREDLYGDRFSPVIPSFSADFLLLRSWDLHLKGSVSRNYRFPSLNDLYFMPGGNPGLRPEKGLVYDAGWSLARTFGGRFTLSAEGSWFDSRIKDWILWVPNGAKKDFYTPLNVMEVHAYGVEQELGLSWEIIPGLRARFDGNLTWSPSINCGEPAGEEDLSVGKQLVYIPEWSSSFIAGLSWRNWSLDWKWCWYSRRYTMTSNDRTISGSVPPYFMNDLQLMKGFHWKRADFSISASVRNLFNEHYLSVLSRPMPGTNFEIFLRICPKFKKR